MPRQEEESMRRISRIAELVKEAQIINYDELEAWCQVNQGITGKTVGRYVNALAKLRVISFDSHIGLVSYIQKEVK